MISLEKLKSNSVFQEKSKQNFAIKNRQLVKINWLFHVTNNIYVCVSMLVRVCHTKFFWFHENIEDFQLISTDTCFVLTGLIENFQLESQWQNQKSGCFTLTLKYLEKCKESFLESTLRRKAMNLVWEVGSKIQQTKIAVTKIQLSLQSKASVWR